MIILREKNPNRLDEMATIGRIDDAYKVAVYDGEGPVPHLHIWKGENPKRPVWQTYVKLLSPEYFPHGQKDFKSMDSHLCKSFTAFMKATDEEGESNWKFAVKSWNRGNATQIPLTTPMPNYDLLTWRDL